MPPASRRQTDDSIAGFSASRDYVQSLARGLAVLQGFSEAQGNASLAQVAENTGISRAAARRLVLTLEHLGYLRPAGRSYALTSRVLELGYGYLGGQNLGELAQPRMEELSHQLGESCSMAVLDGQNIVYVARVPVRRVMTVSLAVGARLPAYCTSMGRALLSGLDAGRLKAWLADCKPRALTRRTLTDKREIARRVAAVRDKGYAWVEQELELGLCSIAVPLAGRDGRVVAALNIGMPFQPNAAAHARRVILPPLLKAARAIERGIPRGWLSEGFT